jgi:hypothetical protein
MILDLKPLDSIGEDLNQLVSEGVIEAKTIEYKRDNYGSSDESRKEFILSNCGLANSSCCGCI